MYKEFTPEGFSETIFKDRYAFTEDETYQEMCRRVAKQMALAETPEKQKKYEDNFYNILITNQFVPGGRILYNSGRNNPQLLNCVSGDTLVHVKGGIKSAKELNGVVEILSKDGIYRKAMWGSYGNQNLYEIKLENGDSLFATKDHEWITKKSVVTTENLKGNSIPFQHIINFEYNMEEYHIGVKHGMVYGDGYIKKINEEIYYSEIRQFGEVNTNVLLKYFEGDNILSYNDKNYGKVYYVSKLPKEFKTLPSKEKSQSYLRGFIAGLLATDGHIDNRGHGGIYQSNLDNLNYIKELASIAGIPTKSIKLFRKYSPYDGSEKPNYKLCVYKNVWHDDPNLVIKETHRNNLLQSKRFSDRRTLIKVIDVLDTNRLEEVFCCVEPETHTMVIGNGYLTKQCFVLGNEIDSKEGWGNIAREMIITSMTGGGCGIDFSDVRPNGAAITGTRGTCPGPVSTMEMIDGCAEPVKSGGGRRVALMFSLNLEHPDIMEFLDAKLSKGKLTHANVSVKCNNTTAFIKAVKNNEEIELSWKGKYKKKIQAKEIWEKIVLNAWQCAEPGFLNWELVEAENNIHYFSPLHSTNPCAEQPLNSHSSCDLGHLVLFRFVRDGDMDWKELANTVRMAVRFLDNVLSVNSYPLPEMKDMADKLRRIGLGTTGLADTLALLGLQYGSPEGNKFVEKLYRFISKVAYESSVMLAIEKGPFPVFKAEEYLESGFMKRMTNKIRSLVEEHGIRNCCILTVAPTGTVSIMSDNCSSGIEPMFAPCYERRFWQGKERSMEIVFHPLFTQFMREGKDISHFVSSHELSVKDHLEVQKIVQRHIDSAVSKTINIPNDYPLEEMNNIWLEYLPYLKGTTFYRNGSRGFVNEDGKIEAPPLTPISAERAKELFYSQNKPKEEAWHVDDCAISIKEAAVHVDDCATGSCSF